ncbi:MAG: hypothetical protein AB8I08_10470 [Sandaracinaceae bacterium]
MRNVSVSLLLWSVGALACLVANAPRAHAQDEVERARAEFRTGVGLAQEENWAEAEAAFQRAYALYPDPVIIFNLAGARAQLGRLVDARASYREFLERATDEHEQYRGPAEAELERIDARIGTIEVSVEGLEDGDIVQIDDETVDARGPTEADPGDHVITVRRGTAEVARDAVTLEPGGVARAELTVVNPERVVMVEGDSDEGLIIGILVAVGVVLAGGAVLTAFLLSDQSTEPFMGNVEPGVVTLPLTWAP